MSDSRLSDRLRDLPPELPDPADRFEQVVQRAQRRRRTRTRFAATTGIGIAVLAMSIPTANQLRDRDAGRTGDHSAVDASKPQAPAGRPRSPGAEPLPGADRIVELAESVTTNGTGTVTVQLGERPARSTAVSTDLSCLSAGTIQWPDGASMTCSARDAASADHALSPGYMVNLDPNQTEILITAVPGVSWKLVTTYVRVEPTPWGVNLKGNTFGVENDRGTPDLVAVVATNGRTGYAFARDLVGPKPKTPEEALAQQRANEGKPIQVPVYSSDGTTRIGNFKIGP